MAVAHQVAETGVVSRPNARLEFVGRASDLPDRIERRVAVGAGKFLFHLFQSRSYNIMMMDVRPDSLDGIEPHAVDKIEIAWHESRWMGSEVESIGPATSVTDN